MPSCQNGNSSLPRSDSEPLAGPGFFTIIVDPSTHLTLFSNLTMASPTNLSLLTRSHKIVAAKRRAKAGGLGKGKTEVVKEVVFNDEKRRYVISCFRACLFGVFGRKHEIIIADFWIPMDVENS